MATAIANLIRLEVRNLVETPSRSGAFAACRQTATITVFRMETIVHVAAEIRRTMKPRAGSNENATREPLRAIIAIRSTVIRGNGKVAVGAYRRRPDLYTDLSLRLWCDQRETDDADDSRQQKKQESVHRVFPP